MMNDSEKIDIKLQREYAWNYFQLHAGQRMSTFNFFIVISALITTALTATFNKDFAYEFIGAVLGVSLILSSYVFWKLDQRVKFLIKHSEDVLKQIENHMMALTGNESFYSDLFNSEENKTDSEKCKLPLLYAKLTYSECFNTVYAIFALIGFFGIVGSVVK